MILKNHIWNHGDYYPGYHSKYSKKSSNMLHRRHIAMPRLLNARLVSNCRHRSHRPNGAFSKCSRYGRCRFLDVLPYIYEYMMNKRFVMLFCELDGGLCHLWRLWRCIRGWESYQTARKNEGWKSGKTCRWSSQSLASADTKRNRALRKNQIGIRNRFLGSVGWLRVRLGVRKR